VAIAFSFLSASSALAELVQPKRPMSSYMLWMKDNRANIVKEIGTKDIGPVGKAAGEKWNALSDKEKKTYNEKADKLKAGYEKDLKAFTDAGGVVQARKSKTAEKAKKDPNAPKRPLSAYILFSMDERPRIVKKLGKDAKVTEVTKALGEVWQTLSDEKQKPYQEKAAKAKKEYMKELEMYKASLA
jgi:high mobility group protein B1